MYLKHFLMGDDVKLSEGHAECLLFMEQRLSQIVRGYERGPIDRKCQIVGHFLPGPCSIYDSKRKRPQFSGAPGAS